MIRRLLAAVVAVVVLTTASAVPARAATTASLITGDRFWTYQLCMAVGDTTIELPYLAQQWNIRGGMAIQASNNCVDAGYPPSRRFTVDTFYDAASNEMWRIRNPGGGILYPGTGLACNDAYTMCKYTNNPVLLINYKYLYAGGTQKRHMVSAALGNLLGLATTNSSGYNARVMNFTAWSIQNVGVADVYSGALMEDLYNGMYG